MKKQHFLLSIIAPVAVFICSCEQSTVQPGLGGTPVITGTLVQSDGTTPAAGAIVTLLPRSAIAPIGGPAKKAAATDKITVQAMNDGSFVIDSCSAGVYALEGVDSDGKAIRLDSVVVSDPTITTDVSQQSLQSTGALEGSVFLDNGGTPDNVFILVFGSDRFVQANSDGSYRMTDLPYGNYTLKFVCVLKECGQSKTLSVSVTPGTTTEIEDVTLSVPDVCIPGNATLTYDSLRMTVSLEWEACTDDGVAGYNIYRYAAAQADQYPELPLNLLPISGTSYTDYNVTLNHQYVYGIAAVSANGNISRKTDPLTATAVCAAFEVDSLTATSHRIFGVHFDRNDRLLVAHGSSNDELSSSFIIDIYQSDLSFDHRITISDSMFEVHNCLLRDDYCVISCKIPRDTRPASSARWDNRIHSYSYTGEKRYTTVFGQTEVVRLAERNDTLYVRTDNRSYTDDGSVITAVYSTDGILLQYITKEQNSHYNLTCTSDGNLYNLSNGTDPITGLYCTVQQYSPQTQLFSDVLTISQPGSAPYFSAMEIKNGVYYLGNAPVLSAYDSKGTMHSRFSAGHDNDWYPENFTINSQGYIALPASDKVILLKPRNN